MKHRIYINVNISKCENKTNYYTISQKFHYDMPRIFTSTEQGYYNCKLYYETILTVYEEEVSHNSDPINKFKLHVK